VITLITALSNIASAVENFQPYKSDIDFGNNHSLGEGTGSPTHFVNKDPNIFLAGVTTGLNSDESIVEL
jgi:hypothetical protein